MTNFFIKMLFFISFILVKKTNSASAPLSDQRDFFMGSYQVGYSYFMQFGPDNQSLIAVHAPNVFPTSINYHVVTALGYGTDYSLSTNMISISIQTSIIDISSVSVWFYTDQTQDWMGLMWIWLMIIDVLSPVYPFALPSILRLNPSPLPISPITTTVSVSTFNSSSLIIGNNLAIHSFIAGFIITSSTGDFQFCVSSLILDSNNIQIVLSYGTAITSISNVRIDTILIDITQITFTFMPPPFPMMDIQFIQYPFNPLTIITFAQPTSDPYNMIAGLSGFKSYSQTEFYLSLVFNAGSLNIGTSSNSYYFQLDITFINFIFLGCSPAYPFFDSLNTLCHDTYCNPIGYYWQLVPDACLPCLYDCYTCTSGSSCTSCLAINYRSYDPITHRCHPMSGHFDDGASNPFAPFCISPCLTCTGAITCKSCINNQYFFNSTAQSCYLCSTSLIGCLTCTSSISCTGCISNSYYLNAILHQCLLCSTFTVGCLTCGINAGNLNCLSCNAVFGFSLAANHLSCLCPVDSYLDIVTSQCYLCSNALHRCYSCSTNAVICSQCQPHFYALSMIYCAEICGDGLLFELQCDDGNLINGDGCDSTCHIQQFYTCTGGSSTTPSTCQFSVNIQITVISFVKDLNQNKLYLNFTISPILALTNAQLSSMLVPNFPTSSIQISYNPITGLCQYNIAYNQSLNSFSNLQVSFHVSSLSNFQIGLNSQTDNNLALKVYSSLMYNQISSLEKASHVLCYFFLIMFFVGWFVSGQQLLVTEMIFVLQYAYSGLFTSSGLDLSMLAFKKFAPTFGIIDISNIGSNYQSTSSNSLPVPFSALGFDISIIQNINISIIVLLIIGLGGGLAYLIGIKFSFKNLTRQAKKIAIFWTFNWMMLMQFPMMTCIWLFCSNSPTSDRNFLLDLICSCCYCILYVGMAGYLLTLLAAKQKNNSDKNEQESQDKQTEKQNSKFVLTKQWKDYFKPIEQKETLSQMKQFSDIDSKRYFYTVYMLYRLLLSVVMVFSDFYSQVGQPVIISLTLLMFVFVCVTKPYKNNISPIANNGMIILLTVPYFYQMLNNLLGGTYDFFQFWGIAILIALLYVVFLINSYFILKDSVIRAYNFLTRDSQQTSAFQTDNNLEENANKKPFELKNRVQFLPNQSIQKFIFREQNNSDFNTNFKLTQNHIGTQSNKKTHKRKKREKQTSEKSNIISHHTTENVLINVNPNENQDHFNQFNNDNKYGNLYHQNNYEKQNIDQLGNSHQQLKQQQEFFSNNNQQQLNQKKDINQLNLDFQTVLKVQLQKANQEQINAETSVIDNEKNVKSKKQNLGTSQMQQTITTINQNQISSQNYILDDHFFDFEQEGFPKLQKGYQNENISLQKQSKQGQAENKNSSMKNRQQSQKPKRVRRNKFSKQ